MYRNREDVIAFKQFAMQEIENLPAQKLSPLKGTEQNMHVLNSVDFERRLLARQSHVLAKVIGEAGAFFLSFSVYLDDLRRQLKQDYLKRRIDTIA